MAGSSDVTVESALTSTGPSALAEPYLERIAKPWGEELILTRGAHSVVKMLRIRPHCRLSLQYHRHKHESLMLLDGGALLSLGANTRRLRREPLVAGVRRDIRAGMLHRLSAGASGADILEVASRLPGDAEDIVRLADDYGRAPSAESRALSTD
ncbi:MAG: hypothetical protein F4066_11715 [Chloroflexi bacterium]|nr:hypothetical protein [Chloroflexota bacterium]MYB23376.1 hypothetical protein [Chloroflexota bacterium]MYD16890.1 hypothetical protein [Chloroflexota bacterium]MYF82146.1 hypothetical protein [Chloroflexota bacterium]MYI05507.1 hypothetical protein [Chloroflexota bacterium]